MIHIFESSIRVACNAGGSAWAANSPSAALTVSGLSGRLRGHDKAMFSRLTPTDALARAGFRFGARGTHSAPTIMLRDLTGVLATVPPDGAVMHVTVWGLVFRLFRRIPAAG